MKWRCDSIECITQAVPDQEYQAKIAEITKILYAAFRQLETIDASITPGTNPGPVSPQASSLQANPFPLTESTPGGTLPRAA